MSQQIQEILNDLYAMDPELKNHEEELKEIIHEMLMAKPDTKFSPEFAEQLKQRLSRSAQAAKKAQAGKEHTPWYKNFFNRPILAGAVGFAVVLLAAIGVWRTYYSGPEAPARFTLETNTSDSQGISPHSTFTLKSTQPLSAKDVKKIIKIDPPVDFEVNKVASAVAVIPEVLADETESKSYAYEIKPTQQLSGETVYAISINNQEYADREYSWAFQVKSGFAVIKTHPGNKTTYVPTNSGIETTFNRTDIQNIEQHFEISPKTEGRFEVHDDTVVFIPKDLLKEQTVYTVTIKKGLTSKGSNDKLEKDYSFSFETQNSSGNIQTAYLNFNSDFDEFIPGTKPDLGIYFGNVDTGTLSAKVYKISSPDEFIQSYQKSRNWDWGWASWYHQNGDTTYDTKNLKPIIQFKPEVITHDYTSYIEIPEELSQGMYIVEMTSGTIKRQTWLQITPMAHYFAVTHDNSLLWLYDFKSKNPYQGAKVELVTNNTAAQTLGTSAQDGLAQFATPDALREEYAKDNPQPAFFKVTSQQGAVTWVKVQDNWGYGTTGASKGDVYWKYLSTDRYTYQMTDSIKFWGVIKGRNEDVRQKRVKVSLYDTSRFWDYRMPLAQQQPLVSQEVTISAFNTISGQLDFKGLAPKTYNLVVTLGDDEVGSASVEVLTYTKPAYQLSVTTSKPAIFAGDDITFTVKGTFFDGTPVSGLKLKYSGYWNSDLSGEVTLNDNGEAQVTLKPEYTPTPNQYWPRGLSLSFVPSSGEEGEISGMGNVTVFGPHMYLQGFQEQQQGENYTFKAKLNTIDIANQVPDENGSFRNEYIGASVQNYGISATITRTVYSKVETGDYYDPINKTVNKTYQYVPKTEDIETITGTTNNSGEWAFSRTFPKQENTYYQINFHVTDRQGRDVNAGAYAYYGSYDNWQPSGLTLSIGDQTYQKEFSIGDNVKLSVTKRGEEPVENKPVLIYRYQNAIGKAVVQTASQFEEHFDASFVPSVQYRAVTLGAKGFEESNSVFAVFKKDDNNLKISIEPDKPSYRPGDKVHLNVKITDKNGNPVAAETNIAVVDEAVFHVLPWNWQAEILDSLYHTIYTPIMTGFTTYFSYGSDGGRGGAESGGCFVAGTQILLADGTTKGIEQLKVGDQILTFKDGLADRTKSSAVIQGISSHKVNEYLLINNKLKVTAEHKIFVNGTWDFAGNAKIGDTLTLTTGQPEIIKTITTVQAPDITVYNIVVGKYHTYFAQGYFVHNAEKGGTSVRDNFADTTFFQTVQTSGNGVASVDFTLADNLTSWRVTARAFEENGLKAGQDIKLIPATLPLFVGAVMNDTYIAGDSPTLKFSAYGTDYKPGSDAELTVTSPTLNLAKTAQIKNHLAYIDIQNLPEGEHELTITAKQGNLSDTLKRKIKVVKTLFLKPAISVKTAGNGAMSLEGNPNGFTKLEIMDAGKGRFYNELLWTSYGGGIRVDQVAGDYFASKMLKDYFGRADQPIQPDLSAYQSETGIRLFPYSDPDLELSAKITDLAPDLVFSDRLNDYFNQSLKDEKTDIHRQAIALYGLASLKKPVLTRLQNIQSVQELTWQDKTYIALGLAKLGDKENARKIYEQDIRQHVHFDGPQAWIEEEVVQTKRVRTTDLVGMLASQVGRYDDSAGIWNYMETHYPERDLDTIERMIFIRSELAHANTSEAKMTLKTNAREVSADVKNGNIFSITLSSDEVKTFEIKDLQGDVRIATFFERSEDPNSLKKNSQLSLVREYYVNGKKTTTFKEGDVVRVKLFPKVAASALDGEYQVVDFVPAGMKPIISPYTYGIDQSTYCTTYPQQIVNNTLYFSIGKNFSGNYNCEPAVQYDVRVVSKGTFTANPAMIQSSNNLESLNITDTQKIEVK